MDKICVLSEVRTEILFTIYLKCQKSGKLKLVDCVKNYFIYRSVEFGVKDISQVCMKFWLNIYFVEKSHYSYNMCNIFKQ